MRHLVVLILTFLFASEALALSKSARMDSLFREATAQVGQVPPTMSIRSFERVLKLHWKYAPAHYQIAKLYMEMNTPLTRQSARKALKQAMRLDPANKDYQMTLGELLGKQGFWWHAVRHYEELTQTEPDNTEAAYWSGYFAVQDYLRYIDRQDPFIFIDKDLGRMFYWKHLAEQDLKRARAYFQQSLEADPSFRDAYNQLGLLHFETGQPEELILVFKRLLEQAPEDKDALMFCGLGYQMLGEMDVAHNYYTRALDQMADDERAMMESVEIVGTVADRKRMEEAIAYADSCVTGSSHRARDRYWRRHDPLFLTEFNERKMEHYGRVAYANLRYSRPFKGIAGWQTDTGKTYIKFGRYLKRVAFSRSKIWFYETFSILFKSNDGLAGWRFGLGSVGGGNVGDMMENVRIANKTDMYSVTQLRNDLGDFYAGRNRRTMWGTPRPPARHVFRDTPQRYIDPYSERKYLIPHQVAVFQEGDSARVEFAYAIPKERVRISNPDGFLNLEDGVFLFDEHWDEVYRKKTYVTMQWPLFHNETLTKIDSLRRNHIVAFRTLRVARKPRRLVVEVRDQDTGSIGTFRELRAFGLHDSTLAMSDLLLASGIEPTTAFPERRSELRVTSNPLLTFGRSEPVFIYIEIYNLNKNRFGRTRYRISYHLTQPDREEIQPEDFTALDAVGAVEIKMIVQDRNKDGEYRDWEHERPVTYRVKYILPERNRISEEIEAASRVRKGAETTVTARYEGYQKHDFTFLQIDASSAPAGFHKLVVTVKDLYTGQIAERDVVFRVVE